jgi:uncharacterized iron-regulated membrane protein
MMHAYLLAAILFSILATGVALLLPRRTALLALAALVVVTLTALYLWHARQQPQPAPGPAPVARSYTE